MSERDEIRMMASIPMIQSAISIGGDGSTRLKLDIPASEIAQVMRLMLYQGEAFEVVVRRLPEQG